MSAGLRARSPGPTSRASSLEPPAVCDRDFVCEPFRKQYLTDCVHEHANGMIRRLSTATDRSCCSVVRWPSGTVAYGRVGHVCRLAAAVLVRIRWSRHVIVQVQVVQGCQAGAHECCVDGLSPAQRAGFIICVQLKAWSSA